MPSDADAVIEEFTVEDAELVVEALRARARGMACAVPDCKFCPAARAAKHLRLIANHLAMEAGKVRMRAEQVTQ